jgi:chorismate-pyruvate lyase
MAALAHPLDDFYSRSDAPLPPLQQIDGEELPEPYKRLLVHSHDMTSTLENYHKEVIHVRVLSSRQQGDDYFREVVLCTESESKPVEFGAIKINLALFPVKARQLIHQEHWPLGRILRDYGLSYSSWPKAFLKVASDRLINSALNLKGANVLYGRRNTLLNAKEQPLAEIVEILPPMEPA